MHADELREIQKPIKQRYRSEPADALIRMSVTGQLDRENLRCHLPERGTSQSGLHPAAGGPVGTLCSGDILLESLAACAGVTLCAVATAMGIEFTSGRVIVEGELDFRGTLGIDRAAPIGMQNLSVRFELDTVAEEASLQKLLQLTERYCVIYQTLVQVNPISSEISGIN